MMKKTDLIRKLVRFLGLALSIVMLAGLTATVPVSAATVKLNKKKISLYVGDTYKLKLKNATGKVKFSSTKKAVATVSSKGTVTAISEGTAKIKVKNAGKTYKCTVTVRIREPEPKTPETNEPGTGDTGTDVPEAPGTADTASNDEAVYNAIIALKAQYPEGTPWTNADTYYWDRNVASGLGYGGFTGMGCQAFAMIASDAAFGDVPAYQFTDKSRIRVGDIIRINNDTHSVVVLKIDGTQITIAEGNYNYSIHWGRVIDIDTCGFVYGYTRYAD